MAVYGRDLGYKSPVPNYTGIDVFAAAGGSHKGYLFNAGNTTVDDSRVLNIQISTSVENPILPGIVLDGTGPVSPVPTERGFHSSFCEVGKQRNNFEMNIGGDATDKVAAENEAYILDPKGRIAFTNGNLFLPVYQSLRYTLGKTLSIRIPVPNGVYTVSMWHAETSFKAAGKRTFDILINDEVRKTALDVFVEGGGPVQPFQSHFFNVSPINDSITVTLRKRLENPFLNGIRIVGKGADRLAVGGDCGGCRDPRNPPPPGHAGSPSPIPLPSPTTPIPGDSCRVAKVVTGAVNNNGFLLSVGGKAIAVLGFAADNVNYLSTNKGERYTTKESIGGTGTWSSVLKSSRYTWGPSLTYNIPAPRENSIYYSCSRNRISIRRVCVCSISPSMARSWNPRSTS